MWAFLRDCLHQCRESHPICLALQNVEWFPDRLLHIRESPTGDQCLLKLIETSSHRPKSQYITLSHCWGGTVPLRTTKSNLNQHHKNIPHLNLPQTFKDCVTVARRLGIEYVWIDSLCIIQDLRSDWAHNSRLMDKVYENALLTVTAVSSPNSSTPFLGPDAPSERGQFQSHKIDVSSFSDFIPTVKARRYDPIILPGFIRGPLEFRAWAWQERHLSIRTIDFTEQQVQWSCATLDACESSGVKDAKVWKKTEENGTKTKTVRDWRGSVEDFSTRHLTYWRDRLPAMSGTVSRYSRDIESPYLAGLWLSDFPRCLAWYRRELSDCRIGKPCMQRSLDNGVPSWSWASVSDSVSWSWTYDFFHLDLSQSSAAFEEEDFEIPIKSCIELISYECQPLNPENIFGEVKPGSFLELRGQVIEAEMESDIHGCGSVRRKGFKPQLVVPDCCIVREDDFTPRKLKLLRSFKDNKAKPGNVEIRRARPTDKLRDRESRRSKGIITCLLLFTSEHNDKTHPCFLILSNPQRASSSSSAMLAVYQRVGISGGSPRSSGHLYENRKDWECWEGWEDLGLWEDWEEWFADAEEKILRIV